MDRINVSARLVVSAAAALLAPTAAAQETRTTHVIDGIYLIAGAGSNVTVSIGDDGVMLVDAGSEARSDALLAAVRELSDGPIRYVINTSAMPDHTGGNATLRQAGATFTGGNATVVGGVDEGAAIFAHENTLHLLVAASDFEPAMLPTETFHVSRHDFYFNGEPVEVFHEPGSTDATQLLVHFRRSDVVSTGDVFRPDGYPEFDAANGGSINGVIDTLNRLVELAIPDTLAEGGTLIVPGHGRISDEGDLVRYRDMVTIIRDRVQALIDEGRGLRQVQAARPSLDYDSRFGQREGWTTQQFIEAIYNSLRAAPGAGDTQNTEFR